jgi:hypothetical protein
LAEFGISTRDRQTDKLTLFALHTNIMAGHLELILSYFSSALTGAYQDKTLQGDTAVSSTSHHPNLPNLQVFDVTLTLHVAA